MAERVEFYFDSRDRQHRIHALKWIPDGEIIGVLQIVHGMAEHIERYDAFACHMASLGYVVVANDHLGHGKSANSPAEYGYFCKGDALTVVIRDIHKLKKITQEQYPQVPYFIFGHSMGSMLLRNYLFRYGTGIQGAIICGTACQPELATVPGLGILKLMALFKGSKYRSTFANNLVNGNPNKRINPGRTEFDWLTTDDSIVDAYIADEACGFLFTLNGFITLVQSVYNQNKKKYLAAMPKNLPVYFIAGEEDPVGNYGAGVKKAYKMFVDAGMKKVSIKLYPGYRHEILNEPCKEEVYDDVAKFLKSVSE